MICDKISRLSEIEIQKRDIPLPRWLLTTSSRVFAEYGYKAKYAVADNDPGMVLKENSQIQGVNYHALRMNDTIEWYPKTVSPGCRTTCRSKIFSFPQAGLCRESLNISLATCGNRISYFQTQKQNFASRKFVSGHMKASTFTLLF